MHTAGQVRRLRPSRPLPPTGARVKPSQGVVATLIIIAIAKTQGEVRRIIRTQI